MAWSVTQGVGATPTQVSISASGTTTLSITPTAIGSLLFATIAIAATGNGATAVPSIASVSDNVDGAWTLVQVSSSAGTGVAGGSAVIAYRDNASSTSARTVTLTNSSKAGALTWALGEATHSGVSFAVDGTATGGSGATSATTSVTVSGPTPSVSGGLAIGVGINDGGSGWTAPTGGIWSALWSLTSSTNGTDGRAVIGTNPTSGSAMSTAFTETGASFQVPSAAVVVFTGPSGTNVNLAGQTASFAEGTVGRNVTYTLGSQTASFSEGTISASTGGNVTVTLGSLSASFSEGTISPNLGYILDDGISLNGQTATFSEGNLSEALGYTLGSITSTLSIGVITPSIQYTANGQSATFAEGIISAQTNSNVTKSLTALTITSSQGVLSPGVGYSVPGQTSSFSQGTIQPGMGYVVLGQSSTLSIGTITRSIDLFAAGQSASMFSGIITQTGGTQAPTSGVKQQYLGLGFIQLGGRIF